MFHLHRHLLTFLLGVSLLACYGLVMTTSAEGLAAYAVASLLLVVLCALVLCMVKPTRALLLSVSFGCTALTLGGLLLYRSQEAARSAPPFFFAAVAVGYVLMLMVVVLAFRLGHNLYSLGGVWGYVTATGEAPGFRQRADDDPRVRREMARSRRYHRPISVVILEADGNVPGAAWPQWERQAKEAFVRRFVAGRVQRLIAQHLRLVDVMFDDSERGRFVLVCPEANEADAEGLIQRIRKEAAGLEGLGLRAGFATFPEGALTLDALLQEAEADLDHESVGIVEPRRPHVLRDEALSIGREAP